MIQVCIVDDQRLMRDGLKTLLGLESDIEVIATAENGDRAVQSAKDLSIDVMLLDIRMPVKGGIEAIKEIHEISPDTRILMLTTYDTRDDVVGALSAGAVGYLLKDMPAEEIADAIRVAHRGGAVLPPGIANTFLAAMQSSVSSSSQSDMNQPALHESERLLQHPERPKPRASADHAEHAEHADISSEAAASTLSPSKAGLTDREMDVLHCLAQGLSNREIARQLFVTEGTVKNHVSNLIAKLALRDRTQAALYAVRNGYGNL
ncbi:response regulator transcription factor [Alicyclobacillus sp. SO9]|uniref:response regulator n=1 Tax=Alicyclobacillus sp. SO9 TaxID=2665646 RepID=UPI0018E88016|nr:response regulator transcription factor [Alicyclobacillus sp. SO9]QQE81471.1 response regulator transcription factor [Alicyclobacillus sp. SO9]